MTFSNTHVHAPSHAAAAAASKASAGPGASSLKDEEALEEKNASLDVLLQQLSGSISGRTVDVTPAQVCCCGSSEQLHSFFFFTLHRYSGFMPLEKKGHEPLDKL
jgi:hypothetical protein